MSDWKSESIDQLVTALSAAQAEIRGAAKDSVNPHLRNRYADLASVWDACREPLTRHGLAVAQMPFTDEGGQAQLRTVLSHASGQWMAGIVPLLWGEEKGLKPMQAMGSAISYARRYGLAALVGVCPEDDDGEGSGGGAQAPARRDRRPDRPAAGPAAPREREPRTWDEVLERAIRSWHQFDRIADGKERTAREHRIAQHLASVAVKDELIAEVLLCKPAEPGKGRVRDPAKVWAEVKRLHETDPGYVVRALKLYLDDKRKAATAPAPEPSAN